MKFPYTYPRTLRIKWVIREGKVSFLIAACCFRCIRTSLLNVALVLLTYLCDVHYLETLLKYIL